MDRDTEMDTDRDMDKDKDKDKDKNKDMDMDMEKDTENTVNEVMTIPPMSHKISANNCTIKEFSRKLAGALQKFYLFFAYRTPTKINHISLVEFLTACQYPRKTLCGLPIAAKDAIFKLSYTAGSGFLTGN